MFSNSGKVSLNYVLRALYSKDVIKRNSRTLLLNANIPFVILVLSNIIRGLPVPKISEPIEWIRELD